MRMIKNTTVVEAATLRDLNADQWRIIATRGYNAEYWNYLHSIEIEAFKALRHMNMLVLTQRRDDEREGFGCVGVFVLLAKVASAHERAWPAVLKSELNKIERKK